MKKPSVIVVSALAAAAASGALGYWLGAHQEREVLGNHLRLNIAVNDALYHSAERGDSRQIQRVLGNVLLGDVRNYEDRFGAPAGTNGFARQFADAQIIANRVEKLPGPKSSPLTNSPPPPPAAQVAAEQEKK